MVNSIKLTLTSKAYLKEFLDECAKRNEIDGLGLRRRKKKSLFGNFLHLLQFSSLFFVCTIICAWILGNRFLTNGWEKRGTGSKINIEVDTEISHLGRIS